MQRFGSVGRNYPIAIFLNHCCTSSRVDNYHNNFSCNKGKNGQFISSLFFPVVVAMQLFLTAVSKVVSV